MGRMFRIISESGSDTRRVPAVAPAPVALAEPPAEVAADDPWPADDRSPFVEVGGPDGVVSSIPRPVPRTVPAPAPAPVPAVVEAPVEPEPRALSVAFHRFPKSGLRLLPAGVSGDVLAYHDPAHPVSVEYAAVRDEIRKQFEDAGPRVLVFAAAGAASGTTTVLLNVAASFARDAGRVLAVDANLAHPGVARRLGVADAPGLAEVLGQSVPLTWALQPSPVPNLHALTAGTAGAPPAALAADFPRLLGQLRQWFDWVLVDAGVWPEALARDKVGPASDGVLLVARQAELDRPEFVHLRTAVTSVGGLLRGYVTTR